MKDLIVLVPDKNVKFGIDGLLSRYESLHIRQISYEIFIHPLHDPGIYHDAANFLRPFSNDYSYAIIFIDYEGCGQEHKQPNIIVNELKNTIEQNGWPNRVEIIVFNPEVEIWMWTGTRHTAEALGWNSYSELKNWLIDRGFWEQNSYKPKRPKEAVEIALREKRIPRSSSIYQKISQKASITSCQDQSFINLRDILQRWFPREE